jgi:V/A-type H+-transporting ATPase subunit F
MYKIGIVGDLDSIMGFTALGFDIYPAYDNEGIRHTVHRLVEEGYAIIYITEEASLIAKDVIDRYKNDMLPAIIVIPGITGSKGIGMNEIRESAKRAIGVDLLFNE